MSFCEQALGMPAHSWWLIDVWLTRRHHLYPNKPLCVAVLPDTVPPPESDPGDDDNDDRGGDLMGLTRPRRGILPTLFSAPI